MTTSADGNTGVIFAYCEAGTCMAIPLATFCSSFHFVGVFKVPEAGLDDPSRLNADYVANSICTFCNVSTPITKIITREHEGFKQVCYSLLTLKNIPNIVSSLKLETRKN
jgi:hypothetical protein